MPVRYQLDGHDARVTIDRPQVLNAIDAEAEAELQAIWARIEADRTVRLVVLTGAGDRAFCAGADMSAGGGLSGLEYWAATRPGGFGGIALRDTLDVPVIARVNGHALGGGLEMVLGCDIVVAAEEATFGLPENEQPFLQIKAEFFGPAVTGWGSPGGRDSRYTTERDHPAVAAWPRG
jgi:crotonobetainyl-CoA hydratase